LFKAIKDMSFDSLKTSIENLRKFGVALVSYNDVIEAFSSKAEE